MNMKKWLLTGSCAFALGCFTACSDNGSSPHSETPASSEGGVPTSSDNGNTSNAGDATISSSSIADDAEPQMACSEIMYNAADGSTLEWIEIYIAGGMDMDNMQNFQLHLSGAVDYTFPAEPLTKGEYIVITNDKELFQSTYPGNIRVFQWTGGSTVKLSNEGDVVNVKVSGEGDVSCAFGNEPPWPSLADGKGRSLVYRGGNAAQPNSWAASETLGGNPGVGNDTWLKPASVRINEIKPYASDVDHSWLELYNAGETAVSLTGWTVEIKARKQTLTITSEAVVPAHGYLVLDGVNDFDTELVVSPDGGEYYLRGPLDGEESSLWVPANTGTSGVVDLADGSTAQGPLTAATPGEKNSSLKIGSVYINEIHYHPNETSSIPFEFMEIINGGSTDVSLYSSTVAKGWKIEGINLEFTQNATIPAQGMILLIPAELDQAVMLNANISSWNAEFVRNAYSIPAGVQIITYSGKLSNRSETIAIKEPYKKETSKSAVSGYNYFYTWHDATLYSDNWPNLKEADGLGFSLHRTDVSTMGYEAAAWTAAEPTPGK